MRPDDELFEVTTQYGRSTRVTGNHSLYVLEQGELRLEARRRACRR